MKRRDFLGLLGATLVSSPNVSLGQTLAPTTGTRPLRIVVVANTYYGRRPDGRPFETGGRATRNLACRATCPGRALWPTFRLTHLFKSIRARVVGSLRKRRRAMPRLPSKSGA